MSLADLKIRSHRARALGGLAPPPATPRAIFADLRWHWALYREDGLPLRDRFVFLGLRVVQRIAYNLGWQLGGLE